MVCKKNNSNQHDPPSHGTIQHDMVWLVCTTGAVVEKKKKKRMGTKGSLKIKRPPAAAKPKAEAMQE